MLQPNSNKIAGKNPNSLAVSICFFSSYLIASLAFYPSVLINGRIWAEEAREFLIPLAAAGKNINSLLYLHKGHLDLFPNIATFLSLVFPINFAPYIFVWVSIVPVAIFSVCLGYTCTRSKPLILFSKSSTLLLLWFSAIGALASVSYITVESHLNTINSWSYIVASVGLLIPLKPSRSCPSIDSIFVSISPLLAFPCVLFAPWLLLQFALTSCRRIKVRNLLFFLSCATQVAAARILPSSWRFGDDRCFTLRDTISILPTVVIKNISPLLGNIKGFSPLAGSFYGTKLFLLSVSMLSILLFVIISYYCIRACNNSSIASALLPDPRSPSSLAIGLVFPIFSWQLLAIPSGGAGAYAQLMMGGGYRYSNSMFLVFSAIASIIFGFVVDPRRFDSANDNRAFYHRLDKFISSKYSLIRGFILAWIALIIIVSIQELFAMQGAGANDFFCFTSRPEWQYRDRAAFKDALRNPASIITCPRGWSNAMQGQKTKSEKEKAEFCNQKYE